eukprot:11164550-Lingulodinium_polyedra.AAC.1
MLRTSTIQPRRPPPRTTEASTSPGRRWPLMRWSNRKMGNGPASPEGNGANSGSSNGWLGAQT